VISFFVYRDKSRRFFLYILNVFLYRVTDTHTKMYIRRIARHRYCKISFLVDGRRREVTKGRIITYARQDATLLCIPLYPLVERGISRADIDNECSVKIRWLILLCDKRKRQFIKPLGKMRRDHRRLICETVEDCRLMQSDTATSDNKDPFPFYIYVYRQKIHCLDYIERVFS